MHGIGTSAVRFCHHSRAKARSRGSPVARVRDRRLVAATHEKRLQRQPESPDRPERRKIAGEQSRGTRESGNILDTQEWNNANTSEQACECSPLEQRRSRRDQHSATYGGADDHRIDEGVRMVCHHQQRPTYRNVFSAQHHQLRVIPAKCELRRNAEDLVKHLPIAVSFWCRALGAAGTRMIRT